MPFNENDVPFAQREARAFASAEDRQAAFVDPRYNASADFRDWVHRCFALTEGAALPPTHDSTRVERVVITADEFATAQEFVQLHQEWEQRREAHADMLRRAGRSELEIQDELAAIDAEADRSVALKAEFDKSPLKHLMILDSTPTTPARRAPVAFSSQKEMLAATRDPRYSGSNPTDVAYRAEIEARVAVTDFAAMGLKASGTIGPTHQGSASAP